MVASRGWVLEGRKQINGAKIEGRSKGIHTTSERGANL